MGHEELGGGSGSFLVKLSPAEELVSALNAVFRREEQKRRVLEAVPPVQQSRFAWRDATMRLLSLGLSNHD
jgi:endonuclease V-like protein UPF0215 family